MGAPKARIEKTLTAADSCYRFTPTCPPHGRLADPEPIRAACQAFPSAADPLPQRAAELQRSFGRFLYLWYRFFGAVNRTEPETMEAFYAP
jgi:hypothetical protein